MRLVTPDMVTDACLKVLAAWHPASLAAIERDHRLAPRTLPRLNTGVLVGEGFRLRQDRPPIALLGTFGTAEAPEEQKDRTLRIVWSVAMEVTVQGQDREDTLRRRDWYSLAAAETLLQYLQREADPIDFIELMDIDLVNGQTDDDASTVGQSRLLFDVGTRGAISLTPRFNPDQAVAAARAAQDPYAVPPVTPTVTAAKVQVDRRGVSP